MQAFRVLPVQVPGTFSNLGLQINSARPSANSVSDTSMSSALSSIIGQLWAVLTFSLTFLALSLNRHSLGSCICTLSVFEVPSTGEDFSLRVEHSTEPDVPSSMTRSVLGVVSVEDDVSLSNSKPSAGAADSESEHRAAVTVADTRILPSCLHFAESLPRRSRPRKVGHSTPTLPLLHGQISTL